MQSLVPGSIAVQPGVPCRNGVYKHRVIHSGNTYEPWIMEPLAHAGETLRLKCLQMTVVDALIGEKDDSFVVQIRLLCPQAIVERDHLRRTGYNELFRAMWTVKHTVRCGHRVRAEDVITLDPGCMACSGFRPGEELVDEGRLIISLMAGNSPARWRVLIGILAQFEFRGPGRPVMLREKNCCLQCAVDQVSRMSGKWYLVL